MIHEYTSEEMSEKDKTGQSCGTATEVPMSRVASIIHRWRTLRTTRAKGLNQAYGREPRGHVTVSEVICGKRNFPE